MEIFEIKEGCYFGSSYFYFSDSNLDEILFEQKENHKGFSIEEEYVWEYLITFLNKLTDKKADYGIEVKITKENVKKLCDDIQNICHSMQTNFNDPSLDELKTRFSIIYFMTDEEQTKHDYYNISKDEVKMFIENRKGRIMDFYNCFIEHIKQLADSTEGNELYIHSP